MRSRLRIEELLGNKLKASVSYTAPRGSQATTLNWYLTLLRLLVLTILASCQVKSMSRSVILCDSETIVGLRPVKPSSAVSPRMKVAQGRGWDLWDKITIPSFSGVVDMLARLALEENRHAMEDEVEDSSNTRSVG